MLSRDERAVLEAACELLQDRPDSAAYRHLVAQLAADDDARAEREAARRAKRTAQGRKWGE